MSSQDPSGNMTLRLGARGSLLSRQQSLLVARQLEAAHPGLRVELVIITTSGDRIQDRPLHEFGGKGLFTKELELALLRNEIDFAVHSYKDVPVTMPLVDTTELVIAAVPAREDPRDVLASPHAKSLAELPSRAKVGTSSLRRQAQVLATRPDLTVLPIRGNVDTRLRKLADNEFDAVLLAYAGVKRAGLFDPSIMTTLTCSDMIPAAGQGALALQCPAADNHVRTLLAAIGDAHTTLMVKLEREVVERLNGDCHSPIAAYARKEKDNSITLRTAVAARDGKPPLLRAKASAPYDQANTLPEIVVTDLQSQGAMQLLHSR